MFTSPFPARGRARRGAAGIAAVLAVSGVSAQPLFQVPLYPNADMSRYDRNTFELGVGYTGQDSYKFGEYTGLREQGAFATGNFNVRRPLGTPADYVQATGWNLGLPSAQVDASAGSQGRWFVSGGYQQIPRYQFEDTRFLHQGLGSERLTLPVGFPGLSAGASQPPANINTVNAYLRDFDTRQERDIWRLGGGIRLGPDLELTLNYRQDDRDGTRLIGAVMGNSAGNPRAALLPYALNDVTRQVEALVQWSGAQAQLNVSYWYSRYDNDAGALTWQNPFAGIAGWGAGAPGFSGVGYPTGFGRLSLAPSNDSHQIQASGGWNLSPRTRLTGTLSYGLSRQDEAFLPYTINGPAAPGLMSQSPGTSLAVPTALPATSLNGELRNTLVDLGVSSRLLPRFTVRGNYQFSDRDNRTPQNWYSYVGGDSSAQTAIPGGVDPERINSSRVRFNLPVGTRENRYKVEGDYELARRTLLRAWFQLRNVDYEVEQLRSFSRTNTWGSELRYYASEYATGALRYVRESRTGSEFSNARPYQASYTNAYIATTPFDNLPTLRQYYLADYAQDLLRGTGTLNPLDSLSVTLTADWYQRRYRGPDCGGPQDQVNPAQILPAQCLGLQTANGESYTVDASWSPLAGLSAFAFYTYGTLDTEQTSRSWGGTNSPTNLGRNWGAGLQSVNNTVGLGARIAPADQRWDLGAQLVYNDGRTKTSVSGPLLAPNVAPVPDVTTRLSSLQLYGKWRYSKQIALRANYWYERFTSADWAYDNAAAWSSNNVLLTGQQSPQYNAHTFMVSIAYENW
jgi:MtrB/PioB family decaheme-associated outer membrane protein